MAFRIRNRFRKMSRYLSLATLFFVLAGAQPAEAHPHIFIAYNVKLLPADAGYVKLHFAFKINALANPLLTPGTSAADRPQLAKNMLANLSAHPFYLYLDMDGQDMGRQEVRPVPAEKEGLYTFDLTLPATTKGLGFSLYDPEYFDDVRLDGPEAVQTKAGKLACRMTERQVGKTVWGIIRAAYVACGANKSAPPPSQPGNENISPDIGAAHNLMP